MPTLKDIAQACGVSTATVSHVIHGRTDRVGAKMRERVKAALVEMRYHRNSAPPVLPQHPTLAVLTELHRRPTISCNTYQLRLLDGIIHTCRTHGYGVAIHFTHEESVTDEWMDLLSSQCAGFILISPDNGSELPARLADRPTPMAVIGTTLELPGANTVDVDNVSFGTLAFRYLFALGHRRIAFAGKNERHTSSWERARGYLKAVSDLLPEGGYHQLLAGGYLESDGQQMAQELLASPEPLPTAIIAANDMVAIGLINTFAGVGLRVPEDISVISIDDGPTAIRCNPPLTTFRQPLEAIGNRAAQILIDKANDPSRPDETVRYSLELIERASTAPALISYETTPPCQSRAVLSNGGS